MGWIKCDSRVKAKCAFKNKCCGDREAVYLDGSECDKFAQQVLSQPPTNADRIRAMSDEELVAGLYLLYRLTMEQDGGDIARHWCDGQNGCVDEWGEIECTKEMHRACILRWLNKEAEPNDPGILGFI